MWPENPLGIAKIVSLGFESSVIEIAYLRANTTSA